MVEDSVTVAVAVVALEAAVAAGHGGYLYYYSSVEDAGNSWLGVLKSVLSF